MILNLTEKQASELKAFILSKGNDIEHLAETVELVLSQLEKVKVAPRRSPRKED